MSEEVRAAYEAAAKAIEEWEDWGEWYGLDRNNAVAQEVCRDAAAKIRALATPATSA